MTVTDERPVVPRYAPEIEAILARPTATVGELARVIDCGINQAYAMVRSGQIRAIHVGRAIKVPTAAIRQLLDGETDSAA